MSGKTKRTPGSLLPGRSQATVPAQAADTKSAETSGNEWLLEIPGLSRRQQSALPAIVAAPSIAEAARRSGIAESTLRRWLEEPGYRNELDRLRKEAYDLAVKQVQALVPECLSIFAKVAAESTDPALRMRAARYLLSYGVKFKEIDELQQKVRSLEQAQEVDKATKPI